MNRLIACGALVLTALASGETPGFAGDVALSVSLMEDVHGRLELAQVTDPAHASRFKPLEHSSLNLGRTRSAWWVRLDFALVQSEDYLLEISYTQIDRIDIYLPRSNGWHLIEAGDTRTRSPDLLKYPTVIVALARGLNGPVYLRLESAGSILLPVAIHESEAFIERATLSQFAFGIYYALLIAMAIYNLFLFAAIRDPAYLYYVSYLLGLLLLQASYFGHASLWLWPGWPAWSNLGAVTGGAVMIAAGSSFVASLARTSRFVPWGHRLLQGVTICALAILPLMLFDYHSALVAVTLLGAIAVAIAYPVPIVLSYIRGCRQARFLALGVALFLPGVLAFTMSIMGWLPPTWWSEHALQIGTAAEAMLFSFALADRINALNAEKLSAQQAVVSAHDSERRRIAQELHDGLGQNLLLLGNRLRRHAAEIPEAGAIREILDDSVDELRTTSRSLHPHQLDRLGLEQAIDSMLEHTLDRAGIEYEANLEPLSLSEGQELHVYRIVQEAVSNIIRHADAAHVWLRLFATRRHFELEIADDGCGLNDATWAHGLGLAGMRSRTEILGGDINIGNDRERGTRIHLRAPLDHD